MKYQLVLQWPSSSPTAENDRLIALEETIRRGLGDLDILDGHDIGSGEMNITDDPKSAFEKAKHLLGPGNGVYQLTAGYRDFDEKTMTRPFIRKDSTVFPSSRFL
jgi:hypothetical protein